MKINKKGFWENETGIGHVHDIKLCDGIIDIFNKKEVKNVVDFGCGMGDYAKSFISNDIMCDAYDGNPNTPKLTNGIGKVIDLSREFDLQKFFDCVISLEVGEHIPKEYEQTFIDNICKHTNNLLIISWAIIGQSGDGHVNCQNNDYIINQIENRNFKYDLEISNFLRNSISSAPWFRNTIMVFIKN
jgi:cyclopropane fatty-acyl-phospholipid synthase-like methyltransferase